MTELSSTPKRGRKLAAMLAGTLALGVLPLALPASAEPRDITEACPPEEVPDSGFTDVDDSNTHFDAINCVAYYDITEGTGDGTAYSPVLEVSRAQMATFIARLMDEAAENGDAPDLPTFDAATGTNLFPCDVNPSGPGNTINPHYVNINRLAQAEITFDDDDDDATDDVTTTIVQGGPGGTDTDCFGPDIPVDRAQMASFINRAEIYLEAEIDGPFENAFSDDEGNVHERNINAIAKEDITAGTGTAFIYNPDGTVKRDQMASFLARKLDYLVEADTVNLMVPSPFVNVSVTPDEIDESDTMATVSATVSSNVAFSSVGIAPATGSVNCTVDTATQSVSPAAKQVTFDVDLSTAALAGTADETCILEFTITYPASVSGATSSTSEPVEITVTEAPA